MGPYIFEPLLKELPWGGQRLARYGKDLPKGAHVGESWELVDLPSDQSRVREGARRGMTLEGLVEELGRELLGGAGLSQGRFPLLVKFIDARERLSVQVHPDQAACARLGLGRPKTEAWLILEADEGAQLYLGFREGVGRRDVERAIEGGNVEDLLERVAVRPGMAFLLPAGTVHAIGAGVVLVEVQQPSDTTFRLYDWGRRRTLHIAEALESLDYARVIKAVRPSDALMGLMGRQPGQQSLRGSEIFPLVGCPYFEMRGFTLGPGQPLALEPGLPWVVVFLGGRGVVEGGGGSLEGGLGDTCLLSAGGGSLSTEWYAFGVMVRVLG